jgi:hypothetical protein
MGAELAKMGGGSGFAAGEAPCEADDSLHKDPVLNETVRCSPEDRVCIRSNP